MYRERERDLGFGKWEGRIVDSVGDWCDATATGDVQPARTKQTELVDRRLAVNWELGRSVGDWAGKH